jgi:hypothetical protein
MKNLILVLIVVILSSCNNSKIEKETPNQNQIVSDDDIYEIINMVLIESANAIKIDGLKESPYKYLIDKDLDSLFNHNASMEIACVDSAFTKSDLKFINQQIQDRKNFRFKKEFLKIKSLEIISADTIQKMIVEAARNRNENFYGLYFKKYKKWYYTIGLPVFSKDKKTVFIKFNSFRSGQTMVYKKVKNKWVYFCSGGCWAA